MSLQGSLDTFALPDVLVLLASTKKTGELHVVGHRFSDGGHAPQLEGRLWFNAGRMVGADGTRGTEPADVVFELLRLADGTFSFGSVTPPTGGTPVDVEPVLEEAQSRLAEWREIERVVPSMAAWLSLADEPPAPTSPSAAISGAWSPPSAAAARWTTPSSVSGWGSCPAAGP